MMFSKGRRAFLAASALAAALAASPVWAQDEQVVKIAYNLPAHHATGT